MVLRLLRQQESAFLRKYCNTISFISRVSKQVRFWRVFRKMSIGKFVFIFGLKCNVIFLL